MSENTKDPFGSFCVGVETLEQFLDRQISNNIDNNTQNLSIQDKISYGRELVDSLGLNIRETNALMGAILSDSKIRYVNSDEYNPDLKWTLGMSVAGLNYMLDNNCSAEQALEYVKSTQNKDDNWLSGVRNKPLPRKVIVNAVEHVEKSNVEKITHLKKVSSYKKRKMLRANTPSRQMNEMEEVITIADRVDNLEDIAKQQSDEILSLKSEIYELQLRMQLNEQNIKIIGDVVNVKTTSLRDEVMSLKDRFTIEQIAGILKIKERKVKYIIYGK